MSDKEAQRSSRQSKIDILESPMDSNNFAERLANLSPAKRALFEQGMSQKRVEASASLNIRRHGAREFAPPSFAQQRLWFLNQLEPDSPAYNVPQVVRLTGALDVEALERSLNQIIARNEILRTTIASHEESPIQRIEDRRTIELTLVDLRDRAAQDREVEARRLINQAIRRQLRADGQRVGLLALLDATPPNPARYLKYRSTLPLKKYKRRIKSFWNRRIHEPNGLSHAGKKPPNGIGRSVISSQSPPSVTGHRDRSRGGILNLETLQRYRPGCYDGSVTLFFGKQTNRRRSIKSWKKYVSGAVEVCYVPGDHETYIREHVEALARQLRTCLDKAEAS